MRGRGCALPAPPSHPFSACTCRSTLLTPNNPCSLFFIMYTLGAKGEQGFVYITGLGAGVAGSAG